MSPISPLGTTEIPEQKSRKWDCIGIGLCALDFLNLLPHYPDSNEKINITESRIQGGGPVPTAMYALSRYGWKTAFIGCVGQDWSGDIILSGLKQGGVDVSRAVRDTDSRTAHAFISVDQRNGNRTVSLDRTHIRDLKTSEVPLDWLKSSRILLCDGRETEATLCALDAARAAGSATVFDASSRRERMDEILSRMDYPIVSKDFLPSALNTADPIEGLDKLLKYGAKAAIVTIGEQGCIWRTSDGQSGMEPGYVVEVVDTTGAGDLFHAGVIHGLLSGWNIDRCCRFGCAAAALKCQALGGQPGVVSVMEVLQFMENTPRRSVLYS
jgi:sugar/nucleoside kinase (ribokinase family)